MTNIEVTLGRHDERLGHLETRARTMEKCVDAIKGNTNKILGGVTIACILLAINVVLTFAGRL